jgi:small subunit ribosomal protein S6e
MNIVVSDPKTGRAFGRKTESSLWLGQKVGQEVDLNAVGLPGYKGQITGGSDKQGFPMKPSLPGQQRKKALMRGGIGYRVETAGTLRRKTVAGSEIGPNIEQVNVRLTKYGTMDLSQFAKPKEVTPEQTESAKERLVKKSLDMAGSAEIVDPKSIKGKVRG